MPEVFDTYSTFIALYFPLGVIGIYRWSVWVVKKLCARRYRPTPENGHRPTLSLVVPVYNEDPEVFRRALASWRANHPQEIIVVADRSDTACIEVCSAVAREDATLRLVVTDRPGKRQALADGIRLATHEIVALVDSDTIWDPGITPLLLAPFADPRVGGVSPRQAVLLPNTLARRLFSIHLNQRYLDEMPFLAAVGDALTCLSGRTAVYRRAAIEDLCDALESEKFWGVRCVSGDDKCLTRLVQERGWQVRYQREAVVRTPGAPDLKTFFKQQLRWTRNSYRSDLKSLVGQRGWIWRRELPLAYHIVDKFTQPFTLLLGPLFLLYSLWWGHWWVAVSLVAWWLVSRSIKLHAHLSQHLRDLILLPVYLAASYFMAVLKIYALMTIRRQGWITRWDTSRLGKLRRFASLPAYAGTAAVVALLGLGVAGHGRVVERHNALPVADLAAVVSAKTEASGERRSIIEAIERERYGEYIALPGDTLSDIARRYHSRLSVLVEANRETLADPHRLSAGDTVRIPVSELQRGMSWQALAARGAPSVTVDRAANTVRVEGKGSVVTLPTLRARLRTSQDLVERLADGSWMLRANLHIGDGVTLFIDGAEVPRLKLRSDERGFVWIRARHGNLAIRNTVITSWDEGRAAPQTDYSAHGRSYVAIEGNGRMDIEGSELAFLGWSGDAVKEGQPASAVYGVSWKAADGTEEPHLLTGTVWGSKFHDNYFGIYTYGVTGVVFRQSEAFQNAVYGFDYHDGSTGLIVEGNVARENGSHGIIFSKHNTENVIRGNLVYGNALHGIMLHELSNRTLVEYNTVYGNTDGIVVYRSHENLIRNNEVRDNVTGVRVNASSSRNTFEANVVRANQVGLFFYDGAHDNHVLDSAVSGNTIGVRLKDAVDTLIADSVRRGNNGSDVVAVGGRDNLIWGLE